MAASRCRFALGTALASLTIRVCERTCDLEQASLIGVTGDPATEEPRLACVTDVGRCETVRGDAKHRQIRFLVAYGDRLGVRSQDPVAQRRQAAAFVALLGHD